MQKALRLCVSLYTIFLGVFIATPSWADQTDLLIPYNEMLFDLNGNVVVPDDGAGAKNITYTGDYWIIDSKQHLSIGNIREAKDFSYSFTKQGNVLTFKIKDNLTYLGADRLAYKYRDTQLSVLIDTDGNLISPEGVYFNKIEPFVDGMAKVTQGKEIKYIDLQGGFVQQPKPNSHSLKTNTPNGFENCEVITLDNTLFLCKKNEKATLVNTKTNKNVPLKGSPRLVHYYYTGAEKVPSDKFWLANYVNGYSVYQLYDSDGNMLYENQFSHVSPFINNHGWVQFKQYGDYQLINTQGKIVSSGKYDSIDVKIFGDNVLTYARSSVPTDKYNNKKYFYSVIDQNGIVILHEEDVRSWNGIECSTNIKILKNKNNEIVWPQNIEKECLIANYAHSPVIKWSAWSYEKEEAEKYPGISKEKIESIADDILVKKANRNASEQRIDYYATSSQYVVGPDVVMIDDIAKLNVPEGYVYVDNKRVNSICGRYIVPAYSNLGQICLSTYNTGYINLADQKLYFDQYKVPNESSYLVKPELDLTSNVMKFAYKYHNYTGNKAAGYDALHEITFDAKWVNILFANEQIIILSSKNYADVILALDKMNSINWAEQIEILPSYQYSQNTHYSCSALPLQDSTLSREYYDFLSENRCFPLSLTSFLANKGYLSGELKEIVNELNRHILYTYSYELK